MLLFRGRDAVLEVMLVHMGGPFWRHKDAGGWSIPKGEYEPPEDPLSAARREFAEELGSEAPPGQAIELGEVKQPSGKTIRVWALEADMDVTNIRSSSFTIEWPRGSDKLGEFPEVDRAGWFALGAAREKLLRGQVPFLDLLSQRIAGGDPAAS